VPIGLSMPQFCHSLATARTNRVLYRRPRKARNLPDSDETCQY
jgi:hypothetical protein